MSYGKNEKIQRAEVRSTDPVLAVSSLAKQLDQGDLAGGIFFCSAEYDPDTLAAEFRAHFDCPVAGCTTAGEIGSRYQEKGIVAAGFAKSDFRFHPFFIPAVDAFDAGAAYRLRDTIRGQLEFSADYDPNKMFGILLVDGLSMQEESVSANISTVIEGVSLVGGSAGDGMNFRETRIFANGGFHTSAGIFIMIESRPDFNIFKFQNYIPSDNELIITEADSAARKVTEINGGIAAEEYSKAMGSDVTALSPDILHPYPIMVEIGDEWYARALRQVNPDGSMTFFCSVDTGLVMTLGQHIDFIDHLKKSAAALKQRFSTILCTIGFDCLSRRMELFKLDKTKEAEAVLAPLNFIGFSSYGV